MRKIIMVLLCLAVGTSVLMANGTAESPTGIDFPKKNITIVVPVAAGGGSDTLARAISAVADKYFGQPIVVVNRGGAGGTIGTTEFLTYKPDGYTLLLAHAAIFTTQPKLQEVTYSPNNFAGVVGLNDQPIVMAVMANSQFKTFTDVVNYGKQLKMAANSVGSIFYVGAMDLMDKAKINAVHVPFNGNSAALTALLGGSVDIGFFHPEEIISHVQAGTIRVLGTMTADKLAAFPDAPTFKELGYDVEYGVWKALLAPIGTDQVILDYLYETFTVLFEDPDFKAYVDNTSTNMFPITGAEVDAKLRTEVDLYSETIDRLHLAN
jgi:tripartite-type tricarboxylate transporter receptor subunit TctC